MHRARADLVNQASDCNELDRTLCHQSRCQHDVRDASEESLHATLCSHNKRIASASTLGVCPAFKLCTVYSTPVCKGRPLAAETLLHAGSNA